LFQGVISESGGSFAPPKSDDEGGENVLQLSAAESRGVEFLSSLGARTMAEARKLPAERLSSAGGGALDRFWPVMDGYVIVGDQYKLYQAGNYNDTPALIGTNSDEGALFIHSTTAEAYTAFVKKRFGLFADRILATYPADSEERALQSQRNVWRDAAFAWACWSWARLQFQTGKGQVFVYYFDHRPPHPNTPEYQTAGASHGSEIQYVFGHPESEGLPWTPDDKALSDAISSYWVNFAKTGDPNGSGLPQWPAFSGNHPLAMHFGDTPQAGPYPNLEKMELWEKYFAWRRGETTLPAPSGDGQ
jgi:para-nitrobenzyl esterase